MSEGGEVRLLVCHCLYLCWEMIGGIKTAAISMTQIIFGNRLGIHRATNPAHYCCLLGHCRLSMIMIYLASLFAFCALVFFEVITYTTAFFALRHFFHHAGCGAKGQMREMRCDSPPTETASTVQYVRIMCSRYPRQSYRLQRCSPLLRLGFGVMRRSCISSSHNMTLSMVFLLQCNACVVYMHLG